MEELEREKKSILAQLVKLEAEAVENVKVEVKEEKPSLSVRKDIFA